MNPNLKVGLRLTVFSAIWFGIGYFPYNDITMGIFSTICATVAMEILYFFDSKTNNIGDIAKRIDFLTETIEGAQDNKRLIIEELMINAANITDDSDFSKGEKVGLEEAAEVVKHRFDKLFEKLSSEGIKTKED